MLSVRFLDNISAGMLSHLHAPEHAHRSLVGTRGASSAEYFLKQGYAVIFMHRQFSLQPFSRNYSHSTHPFLDFLEIEDPPLSDPQERGSQSQITVKQSERVALLSVLRAYKAVQAEGTMLILTFVTVNDYLFLLREVSQAMGSLGPHAMYYLAAAVSDFFLPRQRMVSWLVINPGGKYLIDNTAGAFVSMNTRYNREKVVF